MKLPKRRCHTHLNSTASWFRPRRSCKRHRRRTHENVALALEADLPHVWGCLDDLGGLIGRSGGRRGWLSDGTVHAWPTDSELANLVQDGLITDPEPLRRLALVPARVAEHDDDGLSFGSV